MHPILQDFQYFLLHGVPAFQQVHFHVVASDKRVKHSSPKTHPIDRQVRVRDAGTDREKKSMFWCIGVLSRILQILAYFYTYHNCVAFSPAASSSKTEDDDLKFLSYAVVSEPFNLSRAAFSEKPYQKPVALSVKLRFCRGDCKLTCLNIM